MQSKNPTAQQQLLFQQALTLQQKGLCADAQHVYRQLLNQFPDDPNILNNLAALSIQEGDFAQAKKLLVEALIVSSTHADILSGLGFAFLQQNQYDEALLCYKRVISLKADHYGVHFNCGKIHLELKQYQLALDCFDRAVTLKADFADAHHNRGITLQFLDLPQAALSAYQTAIDIKPDFVEAYLNQGLIFNLLQSYQQALNCFKQAITIKPDYAEAHFNLGCALRKLKMWDAALISFDKAIALKPDYAQAYVNHGNTLVDLRQNAQALNSFDQAIFIKADFAEAFLNKGIALRNLNRIDEFLSHCQHAIALKPDFAEAYNHQGVALQKLMQRSSAQQSYLKAIQLNPDYAHAYTNLSLYKLQSGDYEEGWKLYEWRWRSSLKEEFRHFAQPLWLGEADIAGKTLLIHGEQGLGDFIQFCRYLPELERFGAKVVLETPANLISLIATLPGNFSVIAEAESAVFDYYCPIMSLPLVFHTTLQSIPNQAPYLFADHFKRQSWLKLLGNKTTPRIGLVWSGSIVHQENHNRNITIELLQPLLSLNLEFHCLQKQISSDDMQTLVNYPQLELHNEQLFDFSDTAALVDAMDLIISVDTAVAHLAGAMAKPVWILLPYSADFRWLLNRSDSPWYPTASLLRQPESGDWQAVILMVLDKLSQWLE
jgi:tetratricopeptide (TPR) repeat protein